MHTKLFSREDVQKSLNIINTTSPSGILIASVDAAAGYPTAMPAAEVEMIDTDTTIELLAHYIAREVKKLVGEKFVKIVAYEGVGKGAIAYA